MNNILWNTNELDPIALNCRGRFLMALRNPCLSAVFVKPILLVIHCSENNPWFLRKAEECYTEAIFRGSPKQASFSRRHGEVVFLLFPFYSSRCICLNFIPSRFCSQILKWQKFWWRDVSLPELASFQRRILFAFLKQIKNSTNISQYGLRAS